MGMILIIWRLSSDIGKMCTIYHFASLPPSSRHDCLEKTLRLDYCQVKLDIPRPNTALAQEMAVPGMVSRTRS